MAGTFSWNWEIKDRVVVVELYEFSDEIDFSVLLKSRPPSASVRVSLEIGFMLSFIIFWGSAIDR